MNQAQGEVFDIGYQRYDGPREGRSRARLALWKNGVRTALGLGRPVVAKLLPSLLLVFMLVPALVFIVISSVAGSVISTPGHAEYYQFGSRIILLFSAIIAPELLTTDRRSGVINLYLVRPLSALDYVTGRWLAFFTVTLVLVFLPQIVLLIGFTLGAAEPLSYLQENWLIIPQFIGAGLAVAAYSTTLPLSVAAFTSRRAIATVFIIGVWLISAGLAEFLAETIPGEYSTWFLLLSIGELPLFVNDLIFGSESPSVNNLAGTIPTAVILGWYAVLLIVPGFFLYYRYRRLLS